jgi:hypothetical protein
MRPAPVLSVSKWLKPSESILYTRQYTASAYEVTEVREYFIEAKRIFLKIKTDQLS